MNSFNFNNSCRCCLDAGIDERQLLNMSDTYLFEEETKITIENVLLAESYFLFAGIDRNIDYDCLKICTACKILLQNSYSFRELCRKSNNLILQLNIKEEPTDADFDESGVNIFCEVIKVPDAKPVKLESLSTDKPVFSKYKEKKVHEENYLQSEDDDEEYTVKIKKEPKPTKSHKEPRSSRPAKEPKSSKSSSSYKTKSSSSKSKPKVKKPKKRKLSVTSDEENDDLPLKLVKTELKNNDEDNKEKVLKLHESGQNSIDYIEAQYQCMTCDRPMKNYAMLIKHRQIHPNKGGVIVKRNCLICTEHQIPQTEYEQHCADAHPDYKPQKCLMCTAEFTTHKQLKEHLKKHLIPEKHQCMRCGSFHRTGATLRTHILKSCGDKDDYNCHICGLKFDLITPLNDHVREVHKVEYRSRYFPCHLCKRIYSSAKGYRTGCLPCRNFKKSNDAELLAKGQEPKFHCAQCDDKFYLDEALFCHEIGKHQSGCYCFICEQVFLTATDLRAHNKVVHPRETHRTTYMCDECGKFWKDRFRLREHMRTHLPNPERPCKCPKCPNTFMNKKHLSRHLRQAHNKKFLYECNECGKRSDTYAYLKIHLARAHFPHLKRFQCLYCPWAFASTYDRRRHMEIHTGERVLKIPQKKRNTLSDMRWQRSITRAKNPEAEMSAFYPLLVAEPPLEPAEFIHNQMYEGKYQLLNM